MIYRLDTKKIPPINQIGGKAKALMETKTAGFPVPEGIVLSVDFFMPWLTAIKESESYKNMLSNTTKANCDLVKEIAKKCQFNDEQQEMLSKKIKKIKADVFAVRSSSPEEDLKGTSFAGMYETYLGKQIEEISESVALAFSSCFDYRVISYKKNSNIALENTSIAIIIQRQIASEVSGVGFSLNPLNNAYDEIAINASFGLGEAIVSGLVTPDMYVYDVVEKKIISKEVNSKEVGIWLNPEGSISKKSNSNKDDQALSDRQIIELSAMIKECENYYKTPIDTEWAYEDNKLYLLQSRPITTYLPLFRELQTKPGKSKRFYIDLLIMTQGVNEPMSVLGMDIWKKLIFQTKGGLLSTNINGTAPVLYGREYLSVTAYQKILGKKAALKALDTYDNNIKKIFKEIDLNANPFDGKPEGTEGYIRRSLKKAFAMIPQAIKALNGEPNKIVNDYIEHTKKFSKALENINKNLTLDKIINNIMDEIDFLMNDITPILAGMFSQQTIKKIFKNDDIESEIIALNMNLSGNPTSQMGKLLLSIAENREFKTLESKEDFISKVNSKTLTKELTEKIDTFVELYGARGFKEIDVATKRIYEDIGILYDKLVKINTYSNQSNLVESKSKKAYSKLLSLAKKKGKEKQFIKAAAKLKATFGYREYPKYLIVKAYGIIHEICLNIASKWVNDNRLENPYDIFDLSISEIVTGQTNATYDFKTTRFNNLLEYKKVEHIKEWPLVIDSRGKIYKPKLNIKKGDIIGAPIAPGKVKGKAKVLHTPYEKPLEPGEILIVKATEPSWTPIFTNAAGVVMEIGGPLQHGGIIAREYGIPCVSSLVGIMEIIKDGDTVEVDGFNGIIKINCSN